MRSSRWRKEFCFARLGRGGDKVERNGGRTWGRDRGGDGGSVWRGQGADASRSASGTGHTHEREGFHRVGLTGRPVFQQWWAGPIKHPNQFLNYSRKFSNYSKLKNIKPSLPDVQKFPNMARCQITSN
jgi:hypothetical protein